MIILAHIRARSSATGLALVEKVHRDHGLERLLQTAKAATDSARVKQGTRTDLDEHPCVVRKLNEGNSQDYLLRRLAD